MASSEDALRHELRSYVSRRMGGNSARAHEIVERAVRLYPQTLKAMQRHQASPANKALMSHYWQLMEELSTTIDELLYGFPGDSDYYFCQRQFDELVLPAMRTVTPNQRMHLGHQFALVGDFMIHVHCQALPLDRQRDGMRELCRLLPLLPRDAHEVATKYSLLTALSKLLFMGSERDMSHEDFDRQYDLELGAEAARSGTLKEVLRLMGNPGIVPDPTMRGAATPEHLDEQELAMVYAAQCMAVCLVQTGDTATASQIGRWAAGKPALLRLLIDKINRRAPQAAQSVMVTLRLAGELALASPPLLEALKARGLESVLQQITDRLRMPKDAEEARQWLQRLFPSPGAAQAGRQQQPQQQQAQQVGGSQEELSTLSVRELKARLQAAGIDSSKCTEKRELVELLMAAPAPAPGTAAPSASATAAASSGSSRGAGQERPAGKSARQCLQCGAVSGPDIKLKVCGGCKAPGIYFCSVACQAAMWPQHKAACRAAQKQRREAGSEAE